MTAVHSAVAALAPYRWATTVGELCDRFGGVVQTGPFGSQLHAADYSEVGTPVVMPQDMQDGRIVTDRIARVDSKHVERLKQHKLRLGDVVYSRRGDVGRFAVVAEAEAGWLCGTGSIRIRLNCPDIDIAYVRRYLQQDTVAKWLAHHAKGVTMPNLNTAVIRALPFVYPPLPEQRRIAEILDKADALRAKRRAALAQLDTLTQAVFLDMFGDPATNPKGWPQVPIGDHASKVGSGATPRGGEEAYKAAGITLIRSMNVRDGAFLIDGLAFIDDSQAAQLGGVVVEADDVLLNITGASVARVCRAPADVLPARVNQHVAIIRPTATFNPHFLEQCLLSPSVKERLLKIARAGATREAITKSAIEQFRVVCPPRALQDQFAARVAASEETYRRMREALGEMDSLFASLQHSAFVGKL